MFLEIPKMGRDSKQNEGGKKAIKTDKGYI